MIERLICGMNKNHPLSARAARLRWFTPLVACLILASIVRVGGEWAAIKFHESFAISPVGSFPPSPPLSFIQALTWVSLFVLVWGVILSALLVLRDRKTRRDELTREAE